MTSNPTTIELTIPDRLMVHEDPKTKAKTIALPFQLSDGINAALMICRLNESNWNPKEEIKKITITFND